MRDNDPGEDAAATDQPPQPDTTERTSWIRRHSGTILTTLLFPIVSGLIVLAVDKYAAGSKGDDSVARNETSAQQSTPGPTATSSTPSSAPATTATAASSDIRWSGAISMTSLDLDSVPPHVLPDNGGASVWVSYDYESVGKFSDATLYGLNGGFFTVKPTLALWTTPAEPTRQQCSDLIATQGAEDLPLTEDGAYCVRTAAGRTAFITGVSRNSAGDAYTASVIVWSATT